MCADWNQLFQDPGKAIHDPDPLVNQFIQAVKGNPLVLGRDPRIQERNNAILQYWEVRAWK